MHQKPTDKPLPKKNLATRAGNLRSHAMKFMLNDPGFRKIRRGPGTFPPEIATTAKPNHHLSPSFPRNPLSPPSAPVQRRLQISPAKRQDSTANNATRKPDTTTTATDTTCQNLGNGPHGTPLKRWEESIFMGWSGMMRKTEWTIWDNIL